MPGRPQDADTQHDYQSQEIPTGIDNPTIGLFSNTASTKNATADKAFHDGVNDIVQGRRPFSRAEEPGLHLESRGRRRDAQGVRGPAAERRSPPRGDRPARPASSCWRPGWTPGTPPPARTGALHDPVFGCSHPVRHRLLAWCCCRAGRDTGVTDGRVHRDRAVRPAVGGAGPHRRPEAAAVRVRLRPAHAERDRPAEPPRLHLAADPQDLPRTAAAPGSPWIRTSTPDRLGGGRDRLPCPAAVQLGRRLDERGVAADPGRSLADHGPTQLDAWIDVFFAGRRGRVRPRPRHVPRAGPAERLRPLHPGRTSPTCCCRATPVANRDAAGGLPGHRPAPQPRPSSCPTARWPRATAVPARPGCWARRSPCSPASRALGLGIVGGPGGGPARRPGGPSGRWPVWQRPEGVFSPVQNLLAPELRVGYEAYTADGHYSPAGPGLPRLGARTPGSADDDPPSTAELDGARPAGVRAEGAPTHRGAAHLVGSRSLCRPQADDTYDATWAGRPDLRLRPVAALRQRRPPPQRWSLAGVRGWPCGDERGAAPVIAALAATRRLVEPAARRRGCRPGLRAELDEGDRRPRGLPLVGGPSPTTAWSWSRRFRTGQGGSPCWCPTCATSARPLTTVVSLTRLRRPVRAR